MDDNEGRYKAEPLIEGSFLGHGVIRGLLSTVGSVERLTRRSVALLRGSSLITMTLEIVRVGQRQSQLPCD